MKLAKCHKQVLFTPMTLGEYNIYQGWELPADQNGSDEGYLIEYTDGGKPNHPKHKGYISWSPKEQFDTGYSVVLPEYQQRVVAEYNELADRVNKLNAFLASNAFQSVDVAEQARLQQQHKVMVELITILNNRIAAF